MTHFFYKTLICGIAALLMLTTGYIHSPAQAEQLVLFPLTAEDQEDLARIEHRFNVNKTITSRFMQVASNGSYAEGDLYIERPGKMRLEYDPPSPVMLISDGTHLAYIDKDLKQATVLYLSMTPAEFLLKKDFSFKSPDITITNFSKKSGVLQVTLVKTEEPSEGSFTLVFSDSPLQLRKWIVVDGEGIITSVALLNPKYDHLINPEMFVYEVPENSRTQH